MDDLAPSAFASTAWFNGLKLLAEKHTDYGLAKHLFPDANSDERRSHLKMLRSYRDGHRSPREAKIAAFENLVPGSREFIDMPFWEGLRATATTAQRVELMLKLAPEVQRVAWRKARAGSGFAVLSLNAIRSMTRHASADALACLTLLMLEAIKGEDKRHAFELSTAVCEVLLLLAPWLKVPPRVRIVVAPIEPRTRGR
ncbi:MAG: hypothetical protein ABI605_06480, partial [Rhizobacter sp.]